MKYTGYFRSVVRDNLYRIEIQTGTDATPAAGELTIGPDGFTTSMESGTTMYSPVKYSNASVQIVNDEYMFSLFSSTAKQNTVKLFDASSNLLFTGYTSPNMYDAPYDFEIETYSIEALDGLAILRYYDYDLIGNAKEFRTFAEIINHILTKSGCYSYWYWSKNTVIYNESGNVPEMMTISEQCFFDEDDKPMKMNQVLEEICKFCGVTAIADGDSVYFIDYDAIKEDYKYYLKYTVGTNTATDSSVSLINHGQISSADYTSTGSSLTLKGTYSKVTIKDSLYAVEHIFPPMFEDDDLVNIGYESEDDQKWNYTYGFKPQIQDKYFYINYKSYRNKKYNHYYYDASTGNQYTSTDNMWFNALQAQHYNGVGFFKYQVGCGDTAQEAYDEIKFNEWDDYLLVSNNFTAYDELLLDSKDEFSKPFFMSTDTKFVFKGSLILTDMTTYKRGDNNVGVSWFPTTDIHSENFGPWTMELFIQPKHICMKFGFSIGNYSATDKDTWEAGTSAILEVPFCERSLRNATNEFLEEGKIPLEFDKRKHEIFFNEFPVCNNVEYTDNITEDGFIINCESIGSDVAIAAKPKLSIYTPGTLLTKLFVSGRTSLGASFIKDFDVVGVIPFEGGKNENNTDTEYTYVIDDNYTNELSDITFKICTYDGKQLNYSAVAYPSGSNYKFVDKLTNNAMNLSERAENQMCYKIVNQYKDPVKVLKLNLFDDYKPYSLVYEQILDIDCIVDCYSHNYMYDSVEITLIEKK